MLDHQPVDSRLGRPKHWCKKGCVVVPKAKAPTKPAPILQSTGCNPILPSMSKFFQEVLEKNRARNRAFGLPYRSETIGTKKRTEKRAAVPRQKKSKEPRPLPSQTFEPAFISIGKTGIIPPVFRWAAAQRDPWDLGGEEAVIDVYRVASCAYGEEEMTEDHTYKPYRPLFPNYFHDVFRELAKTWRSPFGSTSMEVLDAFFDTTDDYKESDEARQAFSKDQLEG